MLHAVILYSIGSPDKLTIRSVKKYLQRFLSDKLVVKLPRFLWQPILHSFILRSRPDRLVTRYQQIAIDGKNPYLLATEALAQNLSTKLNVALDEPFATLLTHLQDLPEPTVRGLSIDNAGMLPEYIVRNAYAYTGIGLEKVVEQCIKDGASKVTILPLFPIYTDTTSRRPYLVGKSLERKYPKIKFAWCRSYPDSPLYIYGMVNSVHKALKALPESKRPLPNQSLSDWLKQHNGHVLFSYHSLPKSYIKLGDPYLNEVKQTTDAIVNTLGLESDLYSVAYQSRLGPMAWVSPYIEDEIDSILQRNKSTLLVIAPNFTISCLETLYDLNIKIKEHYLSHGGDNFILAPSMDSNADHVNLLTHLIAEAKHFA